MNHGYGVRGNDAEWNYSVKYKCKIASQGNSEIYTVMLSIYTSTSNRQFSFIFWPCNDPQYLCTWAQSTLVLFFLTDILPWAMERGGYTCTVQPASRSGNRQTSPDWWIRPCLRASMYVHVLNHSTPRSLSFDPSQSGMSSWGVRTTVPEVEGLIYWAWACCQADELQRVWWGS
jgi:hypothetical protein